MRYTFTFPRGEGVERVDRIELPRPSHRLEDGASFDTVSAACRGAALAFMEGVADGWQKVDLAMWLTREYAHATRFADSVERSEHAPAPSRLESNAVDTGRLEDLMQNTRMHTLALCEELALPKCDSDYIDDAIARGLLLPAEDETGSLVWVPLATRRLRLRDRVRALFVVDYLIAPEDYESAFFVCHRCERVLFDSLAKRAGQCSLHRRQSGIVQKDSDAIDHDSATSTESAESASYDRDTFGQAG